MEKGRKKIHYAWFILAGCCIMQGASLGLINNCSGVFYSPVCQDLGFEMGKFTFYRMLYSISSALVLPFVAKSFQRLDVRAVISAAAVGFGGSNMAMGTFTELWQWYAAGMIQGIASSFLCMIAAPILLNNWFHKKAGMAVGISAAFSGLMGMMGSSALGFMIPALGWRASYGIIGAASIVLILPVSLFVLRNRPSDKGMLPYGAEELPETAAASGERPDVRKNGPSAAAAGPEKGLSLASLAKQPVFYLALLAYAGALAGSYLNMFLTSCGLDAGLPMTAAAMMTTMALLGNMSSKLFLGKASDVFGAVRTFELSILVSEIGHVLLLLGLPASVMAGALLYGITPPLSSVMAPLFCKLFWKGEDYGTAYSYVTMFGTLLVSPFNTWFGKFYDLTGSYDLTIGVSGLLLLITLALVWAGGRSLRAEKRA